MRTTHPTTSRRLRRTAAVLFAAASVGSTAAATSGSDVSRLDGPAVVVEPATRVRPPSEASPADASPSGRSAPQGDVGPWKQIFVDDFATDVERGLFPGARPTRYRAYEFPWSDTSGKGVYAPARVLSVRDGVLRKFIHTDDGEHLVSAVVPLIGPGRTDAQLYGRYSVRFRADRIPGYKVVWLLWPEKGTNITGSASGVGGNGEIDFPELDLDDERVSGFVHHQDATDRGDQYWTRSRIDVRDWHTYTIEWSPDLVSFLIDGEPVGRTTERIPDSPMRFTLQTETSLRSPTSDSARGNVEIDWISIWSYSPT